MLPLLLLLIFGQPLHAQPVSEYVLVYNRLQRLPENLSVDPHQFLDELSQALKYETASLKSLQFNEVTETLQASKIVTRSLSKIRCTEIKSRFKVMELYLSEFENSVKRAMSLANQILDGDKNKSTLQKFKDQVKIIERKKNQLIALYRFEFDQRLIQTDLIWQNDLFQNQNNHWTLKAFVTPLDHSEHVTNDSVLPFSYVLNDQFLAIRIWLPQSIYCFKNEEFSFDFENTTDNKIYRLAAFIGGIK